MSKQRQSGFTIVELMIATMVFSLIMVILTVGVIAFTRAYYRGVTASSTQRVARTTIDDITQAVQFSGLKVRPMSPYAAPGGGPQSYGFCIGGTRYSFLPGWQLENNIRSTTTYQNKYVFIRDAPRDGCADNLSQKPQDLYKGSEPGLAATSQYQINGTELLSPHMRVNQADLTQAPGDANLWKMSLRIIYGDADLLSSASAPGGWSDAQKATAKDANCKNATAGTQFCAVSQLTTIIQRRVN